MPAVGTQLLFEIGVLIDLCLGLGLLLYSRKFAAKWEFPVVAALSGLIIVAVATGIEFNPLKQASGVYRYGRTELSPGNQILFKKDGKTSTVVVNQEPDGTVTIRTNGKPDASAYLDNSKSAVDEITQKLLSILPLAFHPDAKKVAIIGMGSGMTTSALLASESIELVDTIEIERAMVEGARQFGNKVESAFSDSRSHIHIEDAKTFFSSHSGKYDIIVSEPSNPWVTGVASLFTTEFYQQIKNYMNPDGLLVQWLQLYETNYTVMSSVFLALSKNFQDFVVFNSDDGNILIIASLNRKLNNLSDWFFQDDRIAKELQLVGIHSLEDLKFRRIGDRQVLYPFFKSTGAPANSDYFPFVELRAPRSRYLNESAVQFSLTRDTGVPVLELLGNENSSMGQNVTPSAHYIPSRQFQLAKIIERSFTNNVSIPYSDQLPEKFQFEVQYLLNSYISCTTKIKEESYTLESLLRIARLVNPYLDKVSAAQFWQQFISAPCYNGLTKRAKNWIALHAATGVRSQEKMFVLSQKILEDSEYLNKPETEYLLLTGLSGLIAEGKTVMAKKFWEKHSVNYASEIDVPLSLRILLSHLQ